MNCVFGRLGQGTAKSGVSGAFPSAPSAATLEARDHDKETNDQEKLRTQKNRSVIFFSRF